MNSVLQLACRTARTLWSEKTVEAIDYDYAQGLSEQYDPGDG